MVQILLFILAILITSIFIGEYQFRKIKNYRKDTCNNVVDIKKDSVFDADMKKPTGFKFENIDMYPSASLQRRGSWRIALGNIISSYGFAKERDMEYSKKL